MPRNSDFITRLKSQKTVWAAGAYDAMSAKLIEQAKFDAVMTSGFGVSASHLGLPDAELYTMTENLNVTRNVTNVVDIPVIADIDTGYGNAINVMRTVREFENAGLSAVILEDQLAPKRCPICVGGVEVISLEEGVAKIEAAVAARRDPNMAIIARTDVVDADEAIRRGKAYVKAGADIIQPISKCFNSIDGLKAMREGCGVPLSLQVLGWLEKELSPEEIESVAGLAVFALTPLMTAAQALQDNLKVLAEKRSTTDLPHRRMDHNEFIDFIGFTEVEQLQLKYLPNA
ncbi:isocitrate lyase/PEP mutase family protein [Pseudohoeflea coraliihabitans]|uniref:Isocitrate lyase/PEP mutase family protein n=1 Tax=Pseudohoeflea coraliihabitans TaxID=2860393 RepID=A0ABS6WMG9_9HYPH|nr:isocitrate lyase/PEP mutase family protein [Pseudohoeflea sp. DP4N28-3]MBW3096612.1 isocitrate lyase/PEP mutase family protein [Pseudohoeflea sp. DP4N28-3]